MEIIVFLGGMAAAWALAHFYYKRTNRGADRRHEVTRDHIISEFKSIPALSRLPSGVDEAARFRQKMRANVLDFFFGVVLRRHPETWGRTLGAAEEPLEDARRKSDHPERIRVLEDVVTFLRSPPT